MFFPSTACKVLLCQVTGQPLGKLQDETPAALGVSELMERKARDSIMWHRAEAGAVGTRVAVDARESATEGRLHLRVGRTEKALLNRPLEGKGRCRANGELQGRHLRSGQGQG